MGTASSAPLIGTGELVLEGEMSAAWNLQFAVIRSPQETAR